MGGNRPVDSLAFPEQQQISRDLQPDYNLTTDMAGTSDPAT